MDYWQSSCIGSNPTQVGVNMLQIVISIIFIFWEEHVT